jgi:hypothetical protein
MAWTKEERAEYMREWRKRNRANMKEYRHEYYMRSLIDGNYQPPDAETLRENCKRWRNNNREKYRAYQREYQRKLRQKSY